MTTPTDLVAPVTDTEWNLFSERLSVEMNHHRWIVANPQRLIELNQEASSLVSMLGASPVPYDEPIGGADLNLSLPEDFKAEMKRSGDDLQAALKAAQQKVEDSVNALRSEKNPPSHDKWVEQMKQLRDETKKEFDNGVDEQFKKLITQGNQHPEERGALITLAQGLKTTLNKVTTALMTAFQWVVEKVQWLWQKVREGALWVWHRVTDLGHTIGHFFSHVFG